MVIYVANVILCFMPYFFLFLWKYSWFTILFYNIVLLLGYSKLIQLYIHVLGSFNGPEPGGLESTIRKWKRELEGGGRERERKKDTGTQALMEQGYFISRNAGLYISLVRWLLSYYIGWNFINSHNMDRLIHTRSLTQKRVTEGSYWKESKQIPLPMISVLRTACRFIRSHGQELWGTEDLWEMENSRQESSC